jgi:hypothetical protein
MMGHNVEIFAVKMGNLEQFFFHGCGINDRVFRP